ncbi:hypothetical protein GALL_496230 [mine drainage metagenome]|uniref:Uncharacterized protein n=1 Tax=mine drainage metagenome TaxID=410659 RepID=A0A1J5PMG2_9ZZZZ
MLRIDVQQRGFARRGQGGGEIGRERGFAGAGQAEEDGGVLQFLDPVVGRAVHRHHALGGQDVVQQGEDRLLDLASIGGVADQDQLAVEIQGDHGFRAASVAGRISLEGRAVDDGEFRQEAVQLGARRATQHVVDEQAVPGKFRHHAHVKTVRRLSAGKQILHEIVAPLHVGEHVLIQTLERVRRHRRVVFPPDRVFDRGMTNDMLIFGRAAGMAAGRYQKRAAVAQRAFVAFQSLLHEGGLHQVIIDCAKSGHTLGFKAMGGVHASMSHLQAPDAVRTAIVTSGSGTKGQIGARRVNYAPVAAL